MSEPSSGVEATTAAMEPPAATGEAARHDAAEELLARRGSLFTQPFWLDAVCPGEWDLAVVRRGGAAAAVLPYHVRTRLGRLRLLEMPPLTPYLGPVLRRSSARRARRLGEEKELLSALIDRLPAFAVFDQSFDPSVRNWLPFHWRGFTQSTLITYRCEDTTDLERLWSGTLPKVRTDVRKARDTVELVSAGEDELLDLLALTFARQGKSLPYRAETARRAMRACEQRGRLLRLVARDGQGRNHAGAVFVWDERYVYYLLSGGSPALRSSGATSLLVWRGIEEASKRGLGFDFEGSMVEGIERFVRAFGGRQVAYIRVRSVRSKLVRSYRAARRLLRLDR